jgi:hypothetical protein
VFPNLKNPAMWLQCVRKCWRTALRNAKLPYFPIYNLRHFRHQTQCSGSTGQSRGRHVGPFVGQYRSLLRPLIDEYRRDSIRKLEALRSASLPNQSSTRSGVETIWERPEPKCRDRVQFTAPNRERRIANRKLGTIEKINDSGSKNGGPMLQPGSQLKYGFAAARQISLRSAASVSHALLPVVQPVEQRQVERPLP